MAQEKTLMEEMGEVVEQQVRNKANKDLSNVEQLPQNVKEQLKGDTGARGINGAKGDKGDRGLKGDKGDTGAKGATGSIGATGAKGDKGDKGNTGSRGATGSNSQSNCCNYRTSCCGSGGCGWLNSTTK